MPLACSCPCPEGCGQELVQYPNSDCVQNCGNGNVLRNNAFDRRGGWNSFNRMCYVHQGGEGMFKHRSSICPPGMHACKVDDPNTWTCLPNWVPCSVAINAYNHRRYINDVYQTTKNPFLY